MSQVRRPSRAGAVLARVESAADPVPSVGRVLRLARQHRGLSLREVERLTGRPNAYLSQIERGVIRRPDPLLLLELAELYGLDFGTLAGWVAPKRSGEVASANYGDESLRALLRLLVQLSASQRTEILAYVEELLRRSRT